MSSVGGSYMTTVYTYGDGSSGKPAGIITGVTDGDTVVSYTYDYLGRLLTKMDGAAQAYKTTYAYVPGKTEGTTS